MSEDKSKKSDVHYKETTVSLLRSYRDESIQKIKAREASVLELLRKPKRRLAEQTWEEDTRNLPSDNIAEQRDDNSMTSGIQQSAHLEEQTGDEDNRSMPTEIIAKLKDNNSMASDIHQFDESFLSRLCSLTEVKKLTDSLRACISQYSLLEQLPSNSCSYYGCCYPFGLLLPSIIMSNDRLLEQTLTS